MGDIRLKILVGGISFLNFSMKYHIKLKGCWFIKAKSQLPCLGRPNCANHLRCPLLRFPAQQSIQLCRHLASYPNKWNKCLWLKNEGGKVGAAKDPISDFSYWKIHIDLSNKFHSSPMKYRSKQIYLNIATSRTCQPYSLRHAPPASSHCPLHLAWMHNDLLSRILTACLSTLINLEC